MGTEMSVTEVAYAADSVIPAILSSVSGNTKELHLENMENVKIFI